MSQPDMFKRCLSKGTLHSAALLAGVVVLFATIGNFAIAQKPDSQNCPDRKEQQVGNERFQVLTPRTIQLAQNQSRLITVDFPIATGSVKSSNESVCTVETLSYLNDPDDKKIPVPSYATRDVLIKTKANGVADITIWPSSPVWQPLTLRVEVVDMPRPEPAKLSAGAEKDVKPKARSADDKSTGSEKTKAIFQISEPKTFDLNTDHSKVLSFDFPIASSGVTTSDEEICKVEKLNHTSGPAWNVLLTGVKGGATRVTVWPASPIWNPVTLTVQVTETIPAENKPPFLPVGENSKPAK